MEFPEESTREVIAGGIWIFTGNIIVSIFGLIFWIVVTRLIGVESIGVASTIISSSMIAITLFTAGLYISIVREVAAHGFQTYISALLFASVFGLLASALSIPLIILVNCPQYTFFGPFLVFFILLYTVSALSLIGFQRFRSYTLTVFIASSIKLILGILFILMGYGTYGVLWAFTLFYIIGFTTAFLLIISSVKEKNVSIHELFSKFKSLVSLTFSNYPYAFSNQLLLMLSIYGFILMTGAFRETGVLYIAFMLMSTINGLPVAILSASLSIATRKGSDPFYEGYRIGISLSTLVIAFIVFLLPSISELLNLPINASIDVFRYLFLSIVPITSLHICLLYTSPSPRDRG